MDPSKRRELLLKKMADLESQKIDCHFCPGHCCTVAMNSMQITPIEALDIWNFLKSHKLLSGQLKSQLQENIRRFHLDRPMPGSGRRNFIRRTYTCPFYTPGARGCALPAEVKPYGCLGFNPLSPLANGEDSCASDPSLLQQREAENSAEDQMNVRLKEELGLSWDKQPIPMALLDLWENPAVR